MMEASESLAVEETYDLSRSPVFTAEDMEKLRKKDKKEGVPLQTSWTFWVDRAAPTSSAAQYQANLKKIYSVSTVQEFWAVFNNIPPIESLPSKYTYHLMRESIQPMWEDEQNKYGGSWKFRLLKKDTSKVWQELLLAAIGEQLTEGVKEGDSICGISVLIRDRDDIVQVWNVKSKLSDNAVMMPKIHKLVPKVEFLTAYYKAHQNHAAFENKK